ncbi:MAG TPA: GxxExxY protein [Gemmatimonadales bacterium]|nr:GxxExxY protein [Gemmatimonadales bacterium]
MAAIAISTRSTVELLARDVVAAAHEVHRCLGPGLAASAYRECLCHELRLRGVVFDREVAVPLRYKGVPLDTAGRLDLVVAGCIAVAVQRTNRLAPIQAAHLLTCLRLKRLPLGLLIDFNAASIKGGIVRIANTT